VSFEFLTCISLGMASGPPAGMDLSENVGPQIIGADMALLALATIAVILRFISRSVSKANLWWDDWILAVALVMMEFFARNQPLS
jgi:hypothetical protein